MLSEKFLIEFAVGLAALQRELKLAREEIRRGTVQIDRKYGMSHHLPEPKLIEGVVSPQGDPHDQQLQGQDGDPPAGRPTD
jgi:hypothetical protein